MKNNLAIGFQNSIERRDHLENYRKICDIQEIKCTGLQDRRAVCISPKIFAKRKVRSKDIIRYDAIIYAHGQAIFTNFDIAIYEMCKIACETKSLVYGIDYRTPTAEH